MRRAKGKRTKLSKEDLRIVIIAWCLCLVIAFGVFLYFMTHDGVDFERDYPHSTSILELVNIERANAGLPPLVLNADLCKVAKLKAEDMAVNNYFDHVSPTYGTPFEMMTSFGITYSAAGENIAAGYGTPQHVMQGWMNSDGHRANILNGNFTQLGVGYTAGGSYHTYWVQEFSRPAENGTSSGGFIVKK